MNTEARILVVDDEANIRSALQRSLKKTRFIVKVAGSGKEALTLMNQEDFNLVISDLCMPGMDGVEFLSMASELYPQTSQILLSGNAERDDLGEAINQCNIEHFIAKPWDNESLLAKTHQVVQENNYSREKQVSTATLNKEINAAETMQRALLPMPIDTHDLRVDWHYKACSKLGGDAFSFRREGDVFRFHMIDVVGHGAPAAMESFALQHLLANLQINDPAKIAAHMNEHYAYKDNPMRYFTLLCGELNVKTGELIFCQAGHPSPLVVRNDTFSVEKVGDGGFPIGLIEDVGFEITRTTLLAGDMLILHSDGFAEADVEDFKDFVVINSSLDTITLYEKCVEWRDEKPIDDDISALFISLK